MLGQSLAAQGGTTRVAENATAAPPVLDTAITQLQNFLDRYPTSTLRPNALLQLGELLVQRADEEFAVSQRAAGMDSTGRASIKPNYSQAIARYEELVRRYPTFEKIDAAQYTLGTLYGSEQRYAQAAQMFEAVAARDSSRFRPEALFRLGDARFELASAARGNERRALFAQSAQAYETATQVAPPQGDIYFLALYKLGWAYYNQANQANQEEYRKAVNVFGRLVEAYDKLTPEQQSRLGLKGEAIEYMAIAFTQVGGAEAANRYFAQHDASPYRTTVIRRVAQSLRDQGDFPGAVRAYSTFLQQNPNDSTSLIAQQEIIDIYQNRMIEGDSAQAARLRLVQNFAPGSAWARANPGLVDSAQKAREVALRQSAQFLLAAAQKNNAKARYSDAARLYRQYLDEFPKGDSTRVVNLYYAEALFGQGDYAGAGAQYARAAYGYAGTDSVAQEAGRNAIVAFDSALVRNKSDRALQDSLFKAVDQFVAAYPNTDLAKKALIEKGRRASETQRWDVMAETFRTYAQKYPNDAYTPTAQKLIGDALYRGGQYVQAQTQWETAQQVAASSGRRALADSIAATRTTAAASYADTLIKQGNYGQAAEDVYVAYAKANPKSAKAPDALRNAIETYMLADSVARKKGDENASRSARQHAADLAAQLTSTYPDYKYRLQYQALRARLLADLGDRDQAISAYQELVAQNPSWSGRADAMVRTAVLLDSAGKKTEAAKAYEQFASAYPRDQRAPGALYNAAVTYREAGDNAAAARAYGTFAQRFPRDERAGAAQAARLDLLRSSGDTAAANAALADACARPSADLRDACNATAAQRAFENGVAMFRQYQPVTLRIATKSQLNQQGVRRASAQKQAMLTRVTQQFAQAIKTGVPEYLAGASYYVGLAQWEYGNFLKNVQLPENLTDAERQAAQQGAAQQAEQFFNAARQTWQELVDKAQSTPALANDSKAKAWVDRARQAVNGSVDANPSGA
jgi:TolA-binding protein